MQELPESGESDSNEFRLEHGSATPEKALAAAAALERLIGRAAAGERRALDRLPIEVAAVLVQYVRDTAGQPDAEA